MTGQQFEVYVQTIEDQQRRALAVAWLMGWLTGYTESGSMVDGDEIDRATKVAEDKFDIKILGSFGPSESPREEQR